MSELGNDEVQEAMKKEKPGGRTRSWLILVALFMTLVAPASAAALVPLEGGSQQALVGNRPDPEGVATKVTLAVLVIDVMDIDEASQTFSADLVVSARWSDPRLAFAPQEVGTSQMTVSVSEVWTPALMALNQRGYDSFMPDVVRIAADGSVQHLQRFQATLASTLELKDFPFDSQILPIRLVAYRYSPEELALDFDRERFLFLGEASVSGWQLRPGQVEVQPFSVPSTERQLAAITFKFEAVRETGYWAMSMMVPLALIVLMAWTVFWIHPTIVPPQVGVATAAIFSLIALRFSLQVMLPRVSYMTRADLFLLGVTLLVFAALGEVVVTARLARQGREELALTIDRWGRWIYLALFALISVLALVR